jgi:hypothetical protein
MFELVMAWVSVPPPTLAGGRTGDVPHLRQPLGDQLVAVATVFGRVDDLDRLDRGEIAPGPTDPGRG